MGAGFARVLRPGPEIESFLRNAEYITLLGTLMCRLVTGLLFSSPAIVLVSARSSNLPALLSLKSVHRGRRLRGARPCSPVRMGCYRRALRTRGTLVGSCRLRRRHTGDEDGTQQHKTGGDRHPQDWPGTSGCCSAVVVGRRHTSQTWGAQSNLVAGTDRCGKAMVVSSYPGRNAIRSSRIGCHPPDRYRYRQTCASCWNRSWYRPNDTGHRWP